MGESTGATTLTDRGTDILVAHWASTGNEAIRADVWLWDDPIGCYFFLPFPLEAIKDRVLLEKLFQSLWVWYEPDPTPEPSNDPGKPRTPSAIRLRDPRTHTFRLELAPQPDAGGLFGAGRSEGDPGFSRGGAGTTRPWVVLYRRGDRVWIAIRIGKPWMQTPDGMYDVDERFPRLRERVPDWSMNRLLSEYRGLPPMGWITGSSLRDAVILKELLRRDVTIDQLRQLLNHSSMSGNLRDLQRSRTSEVSTIASLAAGAGKAKQIEPLLRDEIVRAMQNRSEELGYILRSLLKAMDVDISDLAVECVGTDWLATFEALHYLEARADTVTVYNALRDRLVPKWDLATKERAIVAIRKRLEKP